MAHHSLTPIQHAAALLQEGGLVAFPTETVYGLGANALSEQAVAGIFKTKKRPSFNPLIIHVLNVDEVHRYARMNAQAEALLTRFSPGPLTVVLKRREPSAISQLASAGLDSLALRIPAHPVARALLAECQLPLAAPSANRSGRISPTSSAHVYEEFGANIMVLEGGVSELGLESTIVDLTGPRPRILRHGSITQEMLEAELGEIVSHADDGAITAPGMLKSHYAPTLPVRLDAINVSSNEAILAFGSKVPKGAAHVLNLSETGNLEEAAANLFAMLRKLDSPEFARIAVMPIPANGLGIAINDRLQRASAERA